jgi:hypothetical protein
MMKSMPCRYAIDIERGLVISTAWDRVTFAEIKAHQDQLASDPEFCPEFNQLVDAIAVTMVEASIDQVKTIMGRRLFSPTSRRAFVASNLPVLAVGRLIEMYIGMAGEREKASVFHDRMAALQWLGLEDFPQ